MMKNANKVRITLLLACSYLFLGATIFKDLYGRVVRVADGDTITLLTEGNIQEKIRLVGIDCPEKSQAFGSQAKTFTSDRCFGKDVRVSYDSKDRYGRTLGIVFLSDGKNLNRELLKAGLAWHYKQYDNSPELAKLETEARLAKRGLWSDPNAIAPWDYRKAKKSKQ